MERRAFVRPANFRLPAKRLTEPRRRESVVAWRSRASKKKYKCEPPRAATVVWVQIPRRIPSRRFWGGDSPGRSRQTVTFATLIGKETKDRLEVSINPFGRVPQNTPAKDGFKRERVETATHATLLYHNTAVFMPAIPHTHPAQQHTCDAVNEPSPTGITSSSRAEASGKCRAAWR